MLPRRNLILSWQFIFCQKALVVAARKKHIIDPYEILKIYELFMSTLAYLMTKIICQDIAIDDSSDPLIIVSWTSSSFISDI